jgi:hypothetical protein
MADDACSYVYLLFRLDGTPLYLGKGKGNRWLMHFRQGIKHPNHHLRRIIVAAQAQGKELPVIKIRENLTDAQALELERIFIAAIGREANGGPLVNLTDGGDGPSGYRFTPEQRAAHGAKRKNRKLTPEWRAAISVSMKNNPKVIANAPKAGAASKGKTKKSGWWSTEEGRAKHATSNPGHTGHKHSEATKQQIRAARANQTNFGGRFKPGQKPSEETRARLSASITASWIRRKAAAAARSVIVSPTWANQNSVRYSPTAA